MSMNMNDIEKMVNSVTDTDLNYALGGLAALGGFTGFMRQASMASLGYGIAFGGAFAYTGYVLLILSVGLREGRVACLCKERKGLLELLLPFLAAAFPQFPSQIYAQGEQHDARPPDLDR